MVAGYFKLVGLAPKENELAVEPQCAAARVSKAANVEGGSGRVSKAVFSLMAQTQKHCELAEDGAGC